jgi:phenylalanyl-tRNA synthetase beta chain
VDELLGLEVPVAEQVRLLQQLGLSHLPGAGAASGTSVFQIPSFRVDLEREVDLTEEIARLYGVEKIPATPPRGAVGANPYDLTHDHLAEARRLLTGLGLNEAQGQTLVSGTAARLAAPESVPLENPLSSDMNVLRPSLLPGLLESLRHNLSRKNNDMALFEIGRVFWAEGGRAMEQRRTALALTGLRQPRFWGGEDLGAKWDLHDLKGLLEEFLEQFGLRGVSFARQAESSGLFLESALVQLGRLNLGQMGQVQPTLARHYDLRDPVLLAELNLDELLARRNPGRSFKPLPVHPSIRRDVAMLVARAVSHDQVLNAVKQAKPAGLEAVELFDVFEGRNVPAGQKSMAYAFTYRHSERTLTDAEVNATHAQLLERLKRSLSAIIRDA